MISSISSSNAMNSSLQQSIQKLTDEQKKMVNEIISNYDASNISKSDFNNMMSEIKDAGITPSRDLRSIIEESGFSMPEGPGPQGVKGEGRPKPPEYITDLMSQLQSGDISEEEIQSFLQILQNQNGEKTGSIMDKYA